MATRTNLYLDPEFLSAVAVLGGKPLDELDRDDLMTVLYQFFINAECCDEARQKVSLENEELCFENEELRGEITRRRAVEVAEYDLWQRDLAHSWATSPKTAQSPPPLPPLPPSPMQYAAAQSAQAVDDATIEALLSLNKAQGVE